MLKQPPSKPALNNSSVPDDTQPLKSQQGQDLNSQIASQTASEIPTDAKSPIAETEAGTFLPDVSVDPNASVDSEKSNDREKLAEAAAQRWTLGSPRVLAQRVTRRVVKTTAGKIAIALALLGAGSGLAFAQVAPTEMKDEIKATILPQRQAALPLSNPNDPEVQPFTSTQDLFLTNQIFYRKVEALAGVALTSPSGATDAANKAEKATNATGKSGKATKEQTKAKTKAKTDQAKADADKAAQAEKVVAAAPPVPAAKEVVFTGTTIDSVLEMRVAVAKDVGAIGFATSSAGSITDLDGNVLKSLSAETASLAEISNGLTVDGKPMPGGAFWIYPENGGYVAIGDSWYRGRVLVALRDRGLIAVNYVLLGDYLYSVVGSEMSPSWSIESLKAQAVAARSYALTHNIRPASETYFDLDNTPRFQAYQGIGREADTTQAAVLATAGEFISHEGGIVESLYAASQDIVDDAHQGSGMSQLGAKDLAEQGYAYTEILGHYYPGTALGRIETDAE